MSFPASKKLKILNKVLKEGKTVSKVCREAGIARKTFYQWKKRYQQAPPRIKKQALELNYASGKHHPKNKRYKFEDRVISIIVSHPSWGSRKIAAILCKHRQRISNHAVYSLLEDLNLETKEKREEFSSLYQTFARIEKIYQPKPLRLTPETRKRIIEEVVISKEPVVEICQRYHISRKTFYKWLARYQEAREKETVLLQAMEDNYIKGFAHPRAISERVKEKILYLIRQHPEYSTHKVAQILTEVGNHGVQNVFQRLNLNTYEKRLAYAEVYRPTAVPVAGILDRVKPLIGKIPVISAIPPPKAEAFRRAGPPFIFSFLTSVVFSTIFIYWLRMVSQAPTPGAKIGLLFATIALSVGSIFFAYSMKYYLTLAIVLSFSRQPLEEAPLRQGYEGQGGFAVGLNGSTSLSASRNNNWLARIFGLNGSLRGLTSLKSSTEVRPPPGGGLQPSLEHIKLKRYPFVSIHLPFYNEKKVAERILKACTSIDYPNFEIIVCDDSTDETIDIVKRFAKEWNAQSSERPLIKVLHRSTRQGFKGGALGYALKHMDPRTEFVVVFDADFIPYPDTLTLFIKYFQASAGTTDFRKADMRIQTNKERMNANERIDPRIACVAGYQWHVLNKSENWITRGVRTEYAGSYVIERPGQEILGAMKLIHGSVYAIRADILKKFGWGTSITEDFELTLKLYEAGYKVIYTPYVQAPAECASTLKRLIRQRMRWAEGHSHCVKRRFTQIMTSPLMTLTEKLEFLYLSPYYLQAAFFLVGTFSWLLAETVFRARLPFWTSLWGWSLVLTNFFALPLVNAVGLFLEESEEKDYLGIISFVFLSYLLVPFQAYASVKGFLEKEEGPWFRTPKTGLITDIFTRGRFYRWISGILPGRIAPVARMSADRSRLALSPYLALATANNRFDKSVVEQESPLIPFFDQSKQFAFLGVKVARRVVFSKATLALLLVVTMFLNYLAFFTVKEPKSEKAEVQAVQGGGTEIFRGEPVNTNLVENPPARISAEGIAYAAERPISADNEVYRWKVELPRATYSFGLQESGGIKPVVKMENQRRGGNYVGFTPISADGGTLISADYVKPKVEGNTIGWEIGDGLKAKYTALADRIKADYVIEKPISADEGMLISADVLRFKVEFSDEEESPRIFEQNKDGSISLIMDNYSQEIFRFLAPNVKDAKGIEGEAKMSIQKTAQGMAILTITLDPTFLASATYPITIDPTIIASGITTAPVMYGNGRRVVRDSYGNLIILAAYEVSVYDYNHIYYSNDDGTSWTRLTDIISYSETGASIGIDSNNNVWAAEVEPFAMGEDTHVRKVTFTYSDGQITGGSVSSEIRLDSSGYAYRPSLIVTNTGSNDHVAVAWSFYGQSGGTKRGGARFMHCKISATYPCTSILNWCGANANGDGTDNTECGTAATVLGSDGDADPILVGSSKTARHMVLNQMNPTGDASTTYSKDLVVVLGDDANNDLGTAYTAWDHAGTNDKWAGWSENATNITGTGYDDANGYNLTLAQDNKSKKLVLSYYDTTNSKLEAKRLGEGDIPTGSWQDLTFPTSGFNIDPTVGVDNTNGIYYNFYRNFNQYIAFRYADGANFGSTLGSTSSGGSAASIQNTIRGSKFTLSEKKTFTQMKIYNGDASGNCRAAIYADDGGSPSKPNTLVVQTNSEACTADGTHTFDIEPTTLASGTYWLVANGDTANQSLDYFAGTSDQGIVVSYSYGSFPFTFPSGATNNDNKHDIRTEVGWSGEIVLDRAAGDRAYPSVTEGELWSSTDFTKRKMDLIYTGGTTTYSVYYHTWHLQQRYSYGNNVTGYGDQAVFMDEKEYNSQSADDTDYTSQSVAATTYVVFLFKLKNTNRSANPDLDPTWEGCFVQPVSRDIYLSVYNRELGTWSNIASGKSSTQCSSEADFIQLSPDPPVTGEDKRYFADDWVYFRVYSYNWEASSYTFYSDWFDMTNIWVPEGTLLTLLVLALFLPRIVREIKLRKEVVYEKVNV